MIPIDRRIHLSTLWIFVTLNYLYCDVIGLMDHNLLSQYLTGTVEGMVITENFLFVASILMEMPIAMVLLARILKFRANRWANIIAAGIKTLAMVATLFMGATSYYWFFAIIEITTTIYIVWLAYTWTEDQS